MEKREEELQRPRRSLVTGAIVGAIASLVFSVGEVAILVVTAHDKSHWLKGIVWELPTMILTSLAVLMPLFVAGGVAYAFLLGKMGTDRTHGLAPFLKWAQPVLWVLVVWGYWLLRCRKWHGGEYMLYALLFAAATLVVYALLRKCAVALDSERHQMWTRREMLAGAAVWSASALITARGRRGFPRRIATPRTKQPNILFVVLDTFRADHLSCFGYPRQTTPHIDGFAEQSRQYRNAVSPSCWTVPSHASLFTGLPVSCHRCEFSHPILDKEFDTLAEHLQAANYQTVALSANPWISPDQGFSQGFELFENFSYFSKVYARHCDPLAEHLLWRLGLDGTALDDARMPAAKMNRRLGQWFRDGYQADKPFFIFLNYIEAHAPYCPPANLLRWASQKTLKKWKRKDQLGMMSKYVFLQEDNFPPDDLSELATLYDEQVAYVDRKVGQLLDFFRTHGLDENTLIILTSDHGEHLGEHHMLSHHSSLYQPLVRVPLIVRCGDKFARGVEKAIVQSHDIFPTVLDVAGVEWEKKEAQNCMSLLRSDAGRRAGLSEYLTPHEFELKHLVKEYPTRDFTRAKRRMRALQQGDLKLICFSDGERELYNVADDPMERRNLSGDQAEKVKELEDELLRQTKVFERYERPVPLSNTVQKTSPDQLKALKGLGYIR